MTFLEKAKHCEELCDGRRETLPECDYFCIDESCFNRVFGTLILAVSTLRLAEHYRN